MAVKKSAKKKSSKKASKKPSKKASKKTSKQVSQSKSMKKSGQKNSYVKNVPKKDSKEKKGIGSVNPNSKFYHAKLNLVLRNLFLFGVLFVLSVVLYFVSGNALYENLFMMLSLLFAFITLAFLIVLLIFLFVRFIKKK